MPDSFDILDKLPQEVGAGKATDRETELAIRAQLEAKWASEKKKSKKSRKGEEDIEDEEDESERAPM